MNLVLVRIKVFLMGIHFLIQLYMISKYYYYLLIYTGMQKYQIVKQIMVHQLDITAKKILWKMEIINYKFISIKNRE